MRYLYVLLILNSLFGIKQKSGPLKLLSILTPNCHDDFYEFTMKNGDKIEGVFLGYSEKYSYTVYNKKDKEFIIDGNDIKKIRFSLKYGEPIIASSAKYNTDKSGFVVTLKKNQKEKDLRLNNIEFITFYMVEKNRQKFGEIRRIRVEENQNIIKINVKEKSHYVEKYIIDCKSGTKDKDCIIKEKFLPWGLKKTTYANSTKK